MTINKSIEDQAKALAEYNCESDPLVKSIFWFPDVHEVRLVMAISDIPDNAADEELLAFYFRPSPDDGFDSPSLIAVCAPEKIGRIRLPADWGTWADSREI